MSGYLLDTDWIIDVLNDYGNAARVIADLSPHGVAVSLPTYAELYQGAYYGREPGSAIRHLRGFLDGKLLLPLDAPSMERFAVLRGALPRPVRQQLGDMDLLIAATALHHELTLVTRNLRDFRLVPGLLIYEPG